MGRALDALPYFVFSFMEMGRRGLGRERGKYRLESVALERGRQLIPVYDGKTQSLREWTRIDEPAEIKVESNAPENMTLTLVSPLRLKEKGQLATAITFPAFFQALVQRISLLSRLYGTHEYLPDFSPYYEQAGEVQASASKLYWYDWERYSTKQQTSMRLGGLRGTIDFSGPISPFIPLLRLGETTNVGQGTTFGLGRFELRRRASSEVKENCGNAPNRIYLMLL